MGPFPHDAPKAVIDANNVAGTDGFEFVEFAHPDPAQLETLFTAMGYVEVARHKSRDISLYRQGDITYVLNREPGTHAAQSGTPRRTHGHSLVVSPWGEVLADAGTDVGITYVDLDMDEVARSRSRVPSLTHDRPFEGPR